MPKTPLVKSINSLLYSFGYGPRFGSIKNTGSIINVVEPKFGTHWDHGPPNVPVQHLHTVAGDGNDGTSLPKTTFSTNIGRGLGQESIQNKFGTFYVFLRPLKLATSNLVYKLGLGQAYQKTTFKTKIGGGLGQGSIRKKCGTPYAFLQPLKLATSNLVGYTKWVRE